MISGELAYATDQLRAHVREHGYAASMDRAARSRKQADEVEGGARWALVVIALALADYRFADGADDAGTEEGR